MADNQTSKKRIEAQEKRQRAVQLRKMGWSYGRIASQMDMTKSSVHKAVTKAISETKKYIDRDADLLLAQELERLDDIQSFFWMDASKGNYRAADRILKVMERRHRLLGLDAPTKVAATDPEGEETPARVVLVPAPAGSVEEWVQQVQDEKKEE